MKEPQRRTPIAAALISLFFLTSGCTTGGTPPLQPLDRPIELERFMGDWYVQAFIPIDFLLFSEAGAHNAIENYELADDGTILTTYTFLADGFDGEQRKLTPKGFVYNTETNTEWRMQFLWPFRSAYLIAYLDDDYSNTIVGVPNRNYVWLMSRSPTLTDTEFQALVDETSRLGYDPDELQRVPQRW